MRVRQGFFFIGLYYNLYDCFICLRYNKIIKSRKEKFIMMGFGIFFMLALIAVPVVLLLALAGKLGNNKSDKH